VGDPAADIPDHYWFLFRLAEHAKQGYWPVNTGSLNESQSFFEFCHLVWNYEAAFDAKRMSNG
jgi:hypothetical protein